MTAELARVLDAFAGLRVLVVGDTMLDSYLSGTATRLCQEAPVPVVALNERRDAPGGAGNTAANAAALGAQVSLLSVTGDDAEAWSVRRALDEAGVSTGHLLGAPERRTLAKHRVLAGSHLLVRFDQGTTEPVSAALEEALIGRLIDLAPRVDAIIVSDYAYGVLTSRLIGVLGELQAQSPRTLVLDARDVRLYRNAGVTAVKPNYAEAVALLGEPQREGSRVRLQQIVAGAERLLDETGAGAAAVTLDVDGALLIERGAPPYRTYARPAPGARAAGAGDTFAAALALALAAGADLQAAGEIASAAAGVAVLREGTATCSLHDLREAVTAQSKHIDGLQRVIERVAEHRRHGRRIVFTNGCFDILHRGHIAYLSRAKALGDVLIVGVNTDAGIRRLKGPERPINSLDDRLQVLGALSCVDHLIAFDEDTPIELVRAIRPDVFVKGGDYTRETLPEAEVVEQLGGEVRILPYVEDRSTTGIIARIREAQRAAP
jgi:D-beta-D-heptose 7-phosphate kinase/D-beta-D-heptose 1-phosphate adenosyltransferase